MFFFFTFAFLQACKTHGLRCLHPSRSHQPALRCKGATAACFIHHDRGRTQSRGGLQFSAGWGGKKAWWEQIEPFQHSTLTSFTSAGIAKSFFLSSALPPCKWWTNPFLWSVTQALLNLFASFLGRWSCSSMSSHPFLPCSHQHTSAASLPPALTASISLSPTNTHTRRTMHTFAQHRCPPPSLS